MEYLSNSFHPASTFLPPGPVATRSFLNRIRGRRARAFTLSRYKTGEKSHASSVNSLDISADGQYLLSGGGDGSVVILRVLQHSSSPEETFPVVGKIPYGSKKAHEFAISNSQFYPHDAGVFTTTGKDGVLKIWDTHRMDIAHKFAFKEPILDHHMSFVKSAKPLIAVGGFDRLVRICDLRTVSATQTLSGHNKPITCVRWSRHSPTILATGCGGGKIAFWDIRKAKSCLGYLDAEGNSASGRSADTNSAHSKAVITMEFSDDTNHLVSYGADFRLRLWSTVSMRNTLVNYGRVPFVGREGRSVQMSLSKMATPELIFIPSEDKILVYETHSGERVGCLAEHFGQVLTCAYHPTYQCLFSGASDRNILTWAPATEFAEYEEEKESVAQRQNLRDARKRAEKKILATVLREDNWSDEE